MFLGLRSAIYAANDLNQTKDWYARVLGKLPYFDQPFYVGFNVGGFELGLDPNASPSATAVAYWGVEDARAAYDRLIELGASPHHDVRDVGGGIKVASVWDPFGNVLGVIENPHFPSTHG
jgi:predicted enzyme related to lactoylglutathione lyase